MENDHCKFGRLLWEANQVAGIDRIVTLFRWSENMTKLREPRHITIWIHNKALSGSHNHILPKFMHGF
jgi:hypothetical protein